MANNFPPLVNVIPTNVEIGESTSFLSLIEVHDLDGNPITRYRFRDNNGAATSGKFRLNNIIQPANTWIEVTAAQAANLIYISGLIESSESIGVQVFDGKFWSQAAFGTVTTIRANLYAPVVTTTNGSVLETEKTGIADLFNASDADGDSILRYRIVDKSAFGLSGYFQLNGMNLPQGIPFEITPAQVEDLIYVGGGYGPQSELIGIQAYDGKYWGPESTLVMTTTPNVHRPEVVAHDMQAPIGRVTKLDSVFSYSDLDGNTIKRIRLRDTGTNPGSGFFSIDYVPQTEGQWFEFGIEEFQNVRYHFASQAEFERYNIQVFDGRFWSTVQSARIDAVPRPVINLNSPNVVLDNLQQVAPASLFTQGDLGPPYTRFQVIDMTDDDRSATLFYNGQELLPNVMYEFTAAEFANLRIRGAVNDLRRSFDLISIRAGNSQFWSLPTTIYVSTEPVGPAALTSGARWNNFNGSKTVVTFAFMDPDGAYPLYYLPDDEDFPQNTRALHPAQRAMVRQILTEYASYANLEFVEVPYNVFGAGIMMMFGANDQDGSQGYAYYPGTPIFASRPGDIWVSNDGPTNPDDPDVSNNGYGRLTFVHEIGHALGLKHPFPEGGPPPGVPPYLPNAVDHHSHTVMSYTDSAYLPGGVYPSTSMVYDIMEIQRLYGANTNHRTGDDMYIFPLNDQKVQFIWDGGGIDTLNYSNQVANALIDLRQGRFSSKNGLQFAVLIPFGTEIENARGGRGDDVIIGNELRNLLFGNEGNDTLIGGPGNDVLRGGPGNDTYVWFYGDGNDTIREEQSGGRDVIEIRDPTGQLNDLADDFVFRRLGRDLRIDLTFNRGEPVGSITIVDQQWGGSRVETLRMFGQNGQQIGVDIDLDSIFVASTSDRQRFKVTNFQTQFGFIAVPV
ncbi:MAG TPA: M10 family metallopeptidase C-terminal domain-containing protein [Pirellulaceae bacterium]|nr:M10 family metallopeptidase C-terminal domain-containing protein [Pirellulaceae bacterium]